MTLLGVLFILHVILLVFNACSWAAHVSVCLYCQLIPLYLLLVLVFASLVKWPYIFLCTLLLFLFKFFFCYTIFSFDKANILCVLQHLLHSIFYIPFSSSIFLETDETSPILSSGQLQSHSLGRRLPALSTFFWFSCLSVATAIALKLLQFNSSGYITMYSIPGCTTMYLLHLAASYWILREMWLLYLEVFLALKLFSNTETTGNK